MAEKSTPEEGSATALAGAPAAQGSSEPGQAAAALPVYAILVRRFVDLLAEHEQSIAAAIERRLFCGEPPPCVTSESLMRGMMADLQRRADTMIDADMAHNAVLRRQGRLARDAPSISSDIAHRVALTADLDQQVLSAIERLRTIDRWVYPNGVPEVARAADWVAGFRVFAEDLASYLQREADQEPFLLLERLADFMKGLTAVLELPELAAGFGAVEQEAKALPPPPVVPPRA